MKKSIKILIGIMTFMTMMGSCKKDLYDPSTSDPVEIYKQKFKQYVGGEISSKQRWGFERNPVVAKTRAAEKATVVYNETYTNEFYDSYFQTVMAYFPEGQALNQPDYSSYEFHERATWSNVQLIYTNTSADDEIGLYYYDPTTETFNDTTRIVMIDGIQNKVSTYYEYTFWEDGSRWVKNDTAYLGYDYWTNRGAKRMKAHTFTITMNPNYYFGFYVKNRTTGKTYHTNKFLNENEAEAGGLVDEKGNITNGYVFGLSDDDQPGCEILLSMMKVGEGGMYPVPIGPEKPTLPYQRIICEDLNVTVGNANSDTDFDFNDIVIDIALTDEGVSCILQAAGATLPIRINGDNELEVHKLFGVSNNIMVNTDAEKHGQSGATKDPVAFDIKGNFSSIDKVKIEVFKNNMWIELTSPPGDAASKIAVGTDFEWPYERQSLKEKYPDFPKYATDYENVDDWWKHHTN